MTWKIVPPSDADWCVFTIGGKDVKEYEGTAYLGSQTDYWYEYVAGDEPTRDEASLFVPPGWEVLEFSVTATPHGKYATKREPVDRELFERTAPKWNCVDYADGMHYLSDDKCQWCGKTRDEIAAEDRKP